MKNEKWQVTIGNTSGAKAGMSSSPKQGEDVGNSKGAKPKEGKDRGAVGPNPLQDEDLSRETSPLRSPSALHSREQYGLLFRVESLTPSQVGGPGAYMLPPYTWTECIIWDILSNTINHIMEIKIINPMECLVFVGCRTKNLGLTFANASAYADALHNQTTMWVGHHVKMHCVPRTLKDTRNDLRMVREYTRGLTEERIRNQRGIGHREDHQRTPDPHVSPRGRGLVRRANRYAAAKLLHDQERMVGRRSQTPEQWGTSLDPRMECYDLSEMHCWNLFSGVPRQQGWPPRGHPLGGGHPETMPPVKMKMKIPTTSLNTTPNTPDFLPYWIGRDAGNVQGAGQTAVPAMSETITTGEEVTLGNWVYLSSRIPPLTTP